MIEYCLNYIEDYLLDKKIHNVIGIISSDFNELVNDSKYTYLLDFEYLISTEDIQKQFLPLFNLEIYGLQKLNCIGTEGTLFFIYSKNIDYVKLKLCQFSNLNVKCYYLDLHTRYYKDYQEVFEHRILNSCTFWYKQALIHQNKTEQISTLVDQRKKAVEDGQKILPRLIVVLTTRCNLKCEDCIALVPFYKKQKDFSVDDIKEQIEIILKEVQCISCLELIGGEPFLYANLKDLLIYLKVQPKIEEIQITTNGIIKPNENLLEVLKSTKISVRISDYGLSDNVGYNVTLLKDNNIYFDVQQGLRWMPIGNLQYKNKTRQQLFDEYALCYEGKNCKTLYDGKIFPCTFSSRLCDLDKCKTVEFLPIDKNLTWAKLRDFWTMTHSNACNYCDIMNPNIIPIPAAKQIK